MTPQSIQELTEARLARLKSASEKRDLDELMSWQAEDATFDDIVGGVSVSGADAIRNFYANAWKAIPAFSIESVKVTAPTPDFTAGEMRCEGEVAVDLPHLGLRAGDRLKLVGVSLFWWKWVGDPKGWTGSVDEESLRGWKIAAERAYFYRVKG